MSHLETYERCESNPIGPRLRLVVFVLSAVVLLPTIRPQGPSSYRPTGFALERDEGTVLYDSLRWARGELIYRDFFTFQTPGFYATYALAFAALPEPTVESARALNLLVTALGSVWLAMCVARLAGRAAAFSAAAVHVTLLVAIWPIPYPHWLAETFALGGLVALCEPRFGPRRAAVAGACFAACGATIQSLGFPVLAAGGVATVALAWGASRARMARAAAAYVVGVAAVVGPIFVYFGARGALADLAYQTWVWPFANYAAGNADAMFYAADVATHVREHGVLPPPIAWLAQTGIHATWVLPLIAVIGGVAGLIGAVLRAVRGRGATRPMVATLVAAAAVLPLFSERTRADVVHLGFVGSFGLVAWAACSGAADGRRRGWRGRSVTLVLVALAVVTSSAFAWKAVESGRSTHAWSVRDHVRRLAQRHRGTSGLWSLIEARADPTDTIVVAQDPGFFYLYLRPAAIPITMIPLGPSDDYFTRAQWRWMADSIATRRPVALAIGTYQWRRLALARPDLAAVYRLEGGFYVRDPSGPNLPRRGRWRGPSRP
ncbi:MAG: hypothetical protein IT379_40375 [Deltaproteobacteria bacterium]|nr:hypothetical protein [Deltaproteobacteria bacterium]